MTPEKHHTQENTFQRASFLLFLAAISVGFVFLIREFILTMLMAAIFTGLAYPLYKFVLKRVKKPYIASPLTLLLIILCFLVPIGIIVAVAYQQAFVFLQALDYNTLPYSLEKVSREIQSHYPNLVSHLHLSRQQLSAYTVKGGQEAMKWLVRQGANWGLVAVGGIVNIALMLFIMFYFFIDGERILARIVRVSPIRDDYEKLLFRKFLIVGRGTLKGILLIGSFQGGASALLYWITGVSSPMLLGVLTLFASVIPAFGAGLVWFPVGVILICSGKFGSGIAVLLVGGLVISTVDSLMRPAVVGKDIQMHDLMVLISTLGGLALFGLPGFVVGPILAALFVSAWALFEEIFARELAQNKKPVKHIPEEIL